MTLVWQIVRTMPWVPWLPVAAMAGLIAWSVGEFPPDFASRQLYVRAGLLVVALGVAFSFDDPAAEITDPTPSPFRRRRLLRIVVASIPWEILVGWLLVAGAQQMEPLLAHDAGMDNAFPVGRLLLEAGTLSTWGLALAAVIAKRWDSEPGKIAAALALALYAASWMVPEQWKPWALSRDSRWLTGLPWWWAALAMGLAVIVLASWDSRAVACARGPVYAPSCTRKSLSPPARPPACAPPSRS